jgi:hypothetical protein
MRRHDTLTIISLIAIVLFTFHFADDIARGIEQGDPFDYTGVVIIAVWLYATLALGAGRARLAVMLLFSMGAAVVPLLHMSGGGMVGGRLAGTSGLFFWAWTLIALGAAGLVSAALSVRALLRPRFA